MNRFAFAIAKHLHLDVARGGQVLFDIDFVIAESRLGLGPGGLERALHVCGGLCHLHAAPATTGGCLHDDRIADLVAHLPGLGQIRDATIRAGHARHAKRLDRVLRGDLVSHDADMFGGRADECQSVVLDNLHKSRVFGQESIARMDRLRPRDFAGRDDRGNGQVTVRRRGRPDADRLVGHAHMHCVGIGGGMHGHACHAHFAAGADHAKGDLAAVGNQDLVKHACAPFTRGSRAVRRIRRGRRLRQGYVSRRRCAERGCGSSSSSPRR